MQYIIIIIIKQHYSGLIREPQVHQKRTESQPRLLSPWRRIERRQEPRGDRL